MGQALREGLDEGCFQVFCNPELEGKSVPGFPTGVEGEVIPLSLRELALELQLTGLWSGCQGMVVYPKGSGFPSFFFQVASLEAEGCQY